ncbi:MAG: gamma-butyrobetaine hydroxylase-like domain-containing protein [Nitrospinota bacterium]
MATNLAHRPTDLTLDKRVRELRVEWADGHQSAFPFEYLRKLCPCATCREEREAARQNPLHLLRVAPTEGPLDVRQASQVGHYALQFVWSDGHGTGIYSYDFLRAICPCEECERARRESAEEGGS